jgi:hypothetical protein
MIHFLLSTIFGNMQPGQIVCKRFFHPHNMAKNKTVIIISGPLDPHVLASAQAVLEGKAHSRTFPKKKAPVWGRVIEGKG